MRVLEAEKVLQRQYFLHRSWRKYDSLEKLKKKKVRLDHRTSNEEMEERIGKRKAGARSYRASETITSGFRS